MRPTRVFDESDALEQFASDVTVARTTGDEATEHWRKLREIVTGSQASATDHRGR